MSLKAISAAMVAVVLIWVLFVVLTIDRHSDRLDRLEAAVGMEER